MSSNPKDNETNLSLDASQAKTRKSPRSTQKDSQSTDGKGVADAAKDPKLPHERDESVGMTGGIPSAEMQQAHRDLSKGLQDTSRAPQADQAYKKLKR